MSNDIRFEFFKKQIVLGEELEIFLKEKTYWISRKSNVPTIINLSRTPNLIIGHPNPHKLFSDEKIEKMSIEFLWENQSSKSKISFFDMREEFIKEKKEFTISYKEENYIIKYSKNLFFISNPDNLNNPQVFNELDDLFIYGTISCMSLKEAWLSQKEKYK